jgi:hypothetical protein
MKSFFYDFVMVMVIYWHYLGVAYEKGGKKMGWQMGDPRT